MSTLNVSPEFKEPTAQNFPAAPVLELVAKQPTDEEHETSEKTTRPYEESAYIYDALYSQKRYREEAAALKGQINTRLRSGGNDLLEVACGTGLYFDHFADKFNVEGLDLSPEQLDVARHKYPDTPLYEADMTNFETDKQYDVVMCLFSSIGCAKTPEKLRSTIECMARALKPGGVMLVEPWVFKGELKGTPSMISINRPDIMVTRINTVKKEGEDISVVKMNYLVCYPQTGQVETFEEEMAMGLFESDEYLNAMKDAGMDDVVLHRDGLMNGELFKRGLFVGTKKSQADEPTAHTD